MTCIEVVITVIHHIIIEVHIKACSIIRVQQIAWWYCLLNHVFNLWTLTNEYDTWHAISYSWKTCFKQWNVVSYSVISIQIGVSNGETPGCDKNKWNSNGRTLFRSTCDVFPPISSAYLIHWLWRRHFSDEFGSRARNFLGWGRIRANMSVVPCEKNVLWGT